MKANNRTLHRSGTWKTHSQSNENEIKLFAIAYSSINFNLITIIAGELLFERKPFGIVLGNGVRIRSNKLNESKSIVLIADGVAYNCQAVQFPMRSIRTVMLERFEIIKNVYRWNRQRDADGEGERAVARERDKRARVRIPQLVVLTLLSASQNTRRCVQFGISSTFNGSSLRAWDTTPNWHSNQTHDSCDNVFFSAATTAADINWRCSNLMCDYHTCRVYR